MVLRSVASLLLTAVLAGGAATLITACEEEGPAELLGEQIDETAEGLDEAADEIEDAVDGH